MADNNFITQTLLFAAEVGKDINTLRKQLGKLSDLTTDEQASIVLAINELKNSVNNLGDVTSAIPDWSEQLNETTNF